MSPKDITVVIPTYNRPDSLHRAVESLFWQSVRKHGFSVLIADNSADASARLVFDALAAKAPEEIELSYLHVPAPGVANARNAAMDALQTQLVAFLDDDQSAPIHWLEELLATYEGFGAAVTFGPIAVDLPDTTTRHRAYFENFFGREPHHREGFIDKPFGCGNSLLDTAQIPGAKPWFDTKMNEIGGEDDILWARLKKAGRKFAWSAKAITFEHPLPQRVTLSYTLRRALAYGQGPCTLALRADPPRYGSLLMWMGIGAGKFVLHGLSWLALWITRNPNRAFELDKAVRGLGKVMFWKQMRFYGSATVSQRALPRTQASANTDDGRTSGASGKPLPVNQ